MQRFRCDYAKPCFVADPQGDWIRFEDFCEIVNRTWLTCWMTQKLPDDPVENWSCTLCGVGGLGDHAKFPTRESIKHRPECPIGVVMQGRAK